MLTFEDVIEETVGRIGDEFDADRAGKFVSLAGSLSPARIVFDLEAESIPDAIREITRRVPESEFPATREAIVRALLARERTRNTYVGRWLAIPHARLDEVTKPLIVFARSTAGVPVAESNERAELFFLLLLSAGMVRQARLPAEIALLFESEFMVEWL